MFSTIVLKYCAQLYLLHLINAKDEAATDQEPRTPSQWQAVFKNWLLVIPEDGIHAPTHVGDAHWMFY